MNRRAKAAAARQVLCSAVTASLCWAATGQLVDAEEPHPVPAKGSLVICGGGILPREILDCFLDLSGGSDARLVVIPTASNTAETPRVEKHLRFWREQQVASLTILHTRSRKVADSPEFWGPLSTATGVWFVGGTQGNVVDAYLETATAAQLHALFQRGGVIGGTSAGAAIMSPVMIGQGHRDPEVGRGFGFLPGTVIDQHFLKRDRLPRLLQVLARHPEMIGLGIDEGTALLVQGRKLSVLGESQVLTCLAATGNEPPAIEALSAGAEFVLDDLRGLLDARVRQSSAEVPRAAAS